MILLRVVFFELACLLYLCATGRKTVLFLIMFPILTMLSKSGVYTCSAAGEGLISGCEYIVTGH